MMETTYSGFWEYGVAKDPRAEPGLLKKEDFWLTVLCVLGLEKWSCGLPCICLISVLRLLSPLWAIQMLYFLWEAKPLQGNVLLPELMPWGMRLVN